MAAINYLDSIMPNIWQNRSVANYPLNSVASPITQQKLSAYEATPGTTTTIAALIDIITNAITAGNTNNVPQLKIKQNYFCKNRTI